VQPLTSSCQDIYKFIVITGFNTDIVYEGVTYHVQTEDKGLATPLILSLVYDGGTILASKRSPYNDLLVDEFDEKKLTERLQKQHKLICAAIKGGRIEDLKRMTAKDSAANQSKDESKLASSIAPPEVEIPISVLNQVVNDTLKIPRFSPSEHLDYSHMISADDSIIEVIDEEDLQIEGAIAEIFDQAVVVAPPNQLVLQAIAEEFITIDRKDLIDQENPDLFEDELTRIPMPEGGLTYQIPKVVAKEAILPEEAVAIVAGNMAKPIYPSSKLRIQLGDETEFTGGDRRTLQISVHKGNSVVGLSKAHVIIKILGSSFRPMIFHAKTGPDGIAIVHLQLPSFKAGRAVLLIRSLLDGEETEVRYPVMQGGTPTAW
jgi:hypothetical protein